MSPSGSAIAHRLLLLWCSATVPALIRYTCSEHTTVSYAVAPRSSASGEAAPISKQRPMMTLDGNVHIVLTVYASTAKSQVRQVPHRRSRDGTTVETSKWGLSTREDLQAALSHAPSPLIHVDVIIKPSLRPSSETECAGQTSASERDHGRRGRRWALHNAQVAKFQLP